MTNTAKTDPPPPTPTNIDPARYWLTEAGAEALAQHGAGLFYREAIANQEAQITQLRRDLEDARQESSRRILVGSALTDG